MNRGLDERLREAARAWPDRTAVLEARTGRSATYAEVARAAEDLSERLRAAGVRPGDRVAFRIPKSVEAFVAVYGVLGADAAYVPLDPTGPAERDALVVARSGAAALVTVEEGALRIERREPTDPVPGLAYVLFTSGSTGVPKGVAHTHASALAFVDWATEAVGPRRDDRFASHAPLHFDLSVFDVFVPAGVGAALVSFDETLGKMPKDLAAAIAATEVSVWYSTPSTLRMLLAWGGLERFEYPSLRAVIFAGEVLSGHHVSKLRERWPAEQWWNWYGPTETNVCTAYRIGAGESREEPYPIGPVIAPDEAVVVDDELCVRGGTVMRGYWDDPATTDRAFLDHAGGRWYRTGDLVREEPGAGYVYVGRRDRMVKRQGYRIELGEIEAAMARHPAVVEVAAVARPHPDQGVEIRVFLTARGGAKVSQIELRTHAASALPVYMLPDRFVVLDAFPRTSTDKVDYRALQALP